MKQVKEKLTVKRVIEKVNFNIARLEEEYYRCSFENCDFSGMKVNDTIFEDCDFKCCNFSLTKFFNTLRGCLFIECKMTGTDFSDISRFVSSFRFKGCQLSYASFIRVKMKGLTFTECSLNEASFDNADMESSVFDKCDLDRASFFDTNLERADFSTSYGFRINPNHNRLKKAVFSETGLSGLLSHLDIEIIPDPGL